MDKLSDKKRDEMFTAWQEKQSIQSVASKVQVSRTAVRAYRVKDNWDTRLTKIKAKAQAKADNTAATRRAQHIQEARYIRAKCLEYVKNQGIDSTNAAINGWQAGIRVENEASGEPGAIIKMVGDVGDLESMSLEELEERLRKLRQGESA